MIVTGLTLDAKRQAFLVQDGHILVTGGPGSGKTTIAIHKASNIADGEGLKSEQRILFLSFARPTVARVYQAMQENRAQFSAHARHVVQVETYHSFFWAILKSHGYLIGFPRHVTVMPKPEEAIALSAIRDQHQKRGRSPEQDQQLDAAVADELARLAREEGRICFEQFISIARELLDSSPRLRKLISDRHPHIILDEFQDTSDQQWEIVQALGEGSELIALADPQQRIYDFIGADPKRLDHFRAGFSPKEYSFAADNFRSGGTDIATFGRDLLAGRNVGQTYNDVTVQRFARNEGQAYHMVKLATVLARKRLLDAGTKDWSVAVLVPTISLMKKVSRAFSSDAFMPTTIEHTNAISKEDPILASYVIAKLLEPYDNPQLNTREILLLLSDYFRGRKGEALTQGNMDKANAIMKALDTIEESHSSGKQLRRNSVAAKLLQAIETCRSNEFIGDPVGDWLFIRRTLEASDAKLFQEVAESAKQLQLLTKGSDLRTFLTEDWLRNEAYPSALKIVQDSFVREHFSKGSKAETGVVVMNMHKAKGKQFDEVIIFEDWYTRVNGEIANPGSRILRPNSNPRQTEQSRFNLFVSVTRAKTRTTILTPQDQPCEFLV